ncbi:MAG TPA: right-handed parallel beta-helix repeat-containing protein [Nitrosospira sp.]
MTCSTDRYVATYVVAPHLGPPDCQIADFIDIQAAIDALPPAGGKIFVKAGNYSISKTIQVKSDNIQIQGEGMGITTITADQAMTDSPALEVYDSNVGYDLRLAADTAKGDTTLLLALQDATRVTPGDAILLYSDRPVDCEHTGKHAGEIKRVVAVDKQTGIITLDDQIYDAYLIGDTAKLAKITLLRNIRLADLSITTQARVYHGGRGLTHFRFVDNLQIERVEAHSAYVSGIELVSVINSAVAGCYVHDIHDVDPPKNVRYGIVVGSASQAISISGCRFAHTRHAVTTGGSSGPLANGVQRNIIVSNCTSVASDTAHFDTHDPAENVSFVGCVAIGGVPAAQIDPSRFSNEVEVVGFQMRGASGSIVGCSVLQAIGKGIMIFEGHNGTQPCHAGSDGATITGNMISGVKSVTDRSGKDSLGIGIFLDSSGTSRHTITGNVIKQCEGSAIAGAGNNSDIEVSGNVIDGTNLKVSGASISFDNAARITISGNKIINNKTGRPIEMKGTSEDWHIADNFLAQNKDNSPAPLSNDATVINNAGYNPVGIVASPWHPNGDLTNDGGGSTVPTSGKVYTVRQTPKTIIVTQGDVTEIAIDGMVTGLSAGVFKLGIGETIALDYQSAPATKVWVD